MVSDPVAVFFILAAIVYISIRLEARFNFVRSLGAALVGILLGMLLSNVGILPGDSITYDFLIGPGISAAIVLILLSVDIRSVKKAGPTMVKAFGIGAFGTAIGSMIMGFILFPSIGTETWKLCGQFTGTYTGGGLNYAAVGQALETSSDLFTAGIAADVIVTAIWMVACLSAPVILGYRVNINSRRDQNIPVSTNKQEHTLEHSLYNSGQPVQLIHLASLAAITIGSIWFAGFLAVRFSFFPEVLWLTTIVLIIAQIPAIKKLSGSAILGNYLLLLFLASNGAQSVIANIIKVGPAVFYFALGTVTIHGVVIFGVGRMMRIDPGTLAIASQANVGGSASAMAMASARRYADRILPGVAVGLLGYAGGNYLGLAIAKLMKGLL